MKLKVPHFRQEYPYTCLPACIRMVLAYRGKKHSERQIALACQTLPPFGTQPEAVEDGLKALGYQCRWFEGTTTKKLRELLTNDWPVIIFVYAADLHRGGSGLHAVVLVDLDDSAVLLLDPAQNRPTKLSLKTFEILWANLGNQGMVVWL
jgi:ABC-type bacteriocin/lantibiotic exporter with double-glycine peptidase domain